MVSCHPPPVPKICSIWRTLFIISLLLYSTPKNSKRAFIIAAYKMDAVPRPEPLGVSRTSYSIINPEPILSKISSKFPPSFGIIPQIIKQDFIIVKDSYSFSIFWICLISVNSPYSFKSLA